MKFYQIHKTAFRSLLSIIVFAISVTSCPGIKNTNMTKSHLINYISNKEDFNDKIVYEIKNLYIDSNYNDIKNDILENKQQSQVYNKILKHNKKGDMLFEILSNKVGYKSNILKFSSNPLKVYHDKLISIKKNESKEQEKSENKNYEIKNKSSQYFVTEVTNLFYFEIKDKNKQILYVGDNHFPLDYEVYANHYLKKIIKNCLKQGKKVCVLIEAGMKNQEFRGSLIASSLDKLKFNNINYLKKLLDFRRILAPTFISNYEKCCNQIIDCTKEEEIIKTLDNINQISIAELKTIFNKVKSVSNELFKKEEYRKLMNFCENFIEKIISNKIKFLLNWSMTNNEKIFDIQMKIFNDLNLDHAEIKSQALLYLSEIHLMLINLNDILVINEILNTQYDIYILQYGAAHTEMMKYFLKPQALQNTFYFSNFQKYIKIQSHDCDEIVKFTEKYTILNNEKFPQNLKKIYPKGILGKNKRKLTKISKKNSHNNKEINNNFEIEEKDIEPKQENLNINSDSDSIKNNMNQKKYNKTQLNNLNEQETKLKLSTPNQTQELTQQNFNDQNMSDDFIEYSKEKTDKEISENHIEFLKH